MVKRESKAKHLCAFRLRFGRIVRVIEKYWEKEPSSVCMICCGIGHERMGNCENRPSQCIICSSFYKVEEHCCIVAGYNKNKGKTCDHVIVKCASYRGSHLANFN